MWFGQFGHSWFKAKSGNNSDEDFNLDDTEEGGDEDDEDIFLINDDAPGKKQRADQDAKIGEEREAL